MILWGAVVTQIGVLSPFIVCKKNANFLRNEAWLQNVGALKKNSCSAETYILGSDAPVYT